jgi:hypothetical protein
LGQAMVEFSMLIKEHWNCCSDYKWKEINSFNFMLLSDISNWKDIVAL